MTNKQKTAIANAQAVVGHAFHHDGEHGVIDRVALEYGLYGGTDPLLICRFGERVAVLKMSEIGSR